MERFMDRSRTMELNCWIASYLTMTTVTCCHCKCLMSINFQTKGEMTRLITGNGAVWIKVQYFTGLLRPLRFALSSRNDDVCRRHCETIIKKIKQHKITMPITNNGVMWLNILHFSGLLRAGALAMTTRAYRLCEERSDEAIQKKQYTKALQKLVIGRFR